MARSYPLKSAITIQLEDGTETTPNTITLKYYGEVPDLPDVIIDAPLRPILDRGNFSHVEEDDDTIDFPELELTIDMVDTDVSAGKHVLEQWFNKHLAADGTTTLESTNDGNAQARRLSDNSLVSIGIPSDRFTVYFKILFDNSETDKAFGRSYKYFEPISCTVSSGKDAQIKIRGRIYGTYEEITSLT